MTDQGLSVDAYLRQLKEKGLSDRSITIYRSVLTHFQQGITKADIEAYQSKIAHYKPVTKRGCLEIVRRYLQTVNPHLVKAVVLPKVPKRLPQNIPTQDEVRVILQQPDLSTFGGIRNRAILELFYSAGLRRKELAYLNLDDIDWVKHLVRVNHGKNNKDRIVPVSDTALLWLKKYAHKIRPSYSPKSNRLFLKKDGTGLSGEMLYKLVRRYGTYGCHKFRHAFATHLLQNGMKETSLQKLLGHTLISTTQVYTKVTIQDIQKTYRKAHPFKGHT